MLTRWFLICMGMTSASMTMSGELPEFALVRHLLDGGCSNASLGVMTGNLYGLATRTESPLEVAGQGVGWRRELTFGGGKSIRLERVAPAGRLRGLRLEYRANERPILFVATGADCRLRTARELRYGQDGRAVELVHLNADFAPTLVEPLDPPVPEGPQTAGVRVGLVDSGVNYTLGPVAIRLARDRLGDLIGYDFWDLDPRPFDANPARSPFFPQRHGTRTASLILREAPASTLVPYRYPRPDMSRMGDLIEHASAHDVTIIGLPMGSNRRDEWATFARVAGSHPKLLFVVSAGNHGLNIDKAPTYPAAMSLANMIVVTSADDYGRPATGTNWGPRSVDLLVPAEQVEVLSFAGQTIRVSGSSYAVSRVVALAARLRERRPSWQSQELKSAIFALASRPTEPTHVRVGFLADPLVDTARIERVGNKTFNLKATGDSLATHRLTLNVVLIAGSKWDPDTITKALRETKEIYSQCGVQFTKADLHAVRVSDYLMDFSTGTAKTLIDHLQLPKPIVFLIRQSKMRVPFEGEAFGDANTSRRPWLKGTVWLVEDVRDPEVALAHELFHVLANSGEHITLDNNLMRERTHSDHRQLTSEQCRRVLHMGTKQGLLAPVG